MIGKSALMVGIVAFVVGAGGVWGLAASGSLPGAATKTSTLQLGTETVPLQAVSKSAPPLTGWDTAFSQHLDVRQMGLFDSSGPAAWDAGKHPFVYVTTNGAGYGGFPSPDVNTPGLAIVDGKTYEVVATKQYSLDGVDVKKLWEDHGVGVSPDGKWIYLPTGDASKPTIESGRLLIIDAKTLKVHQVLQTASYPHHVKTIELNNGTGGVKKLVLVETFNNVAPGSGTYLLDPNDNNRVVGGFRSEEVQGDPYLAFPHPDGRHLFVGMPNPAGTYSDPEIKDHHEGLWAVVDMKTWKPVKFYVGGYDPIWTVFTADGKYAYLSDGGSDMVIKVDNGQQKSVGESRSSVHGNYGIHLNYNETRLYTVEKGEASHNRGHLIGLVDPIALSPKDSFEVHCLRGDHGIVNPLSPNELWVSYNSNFQDVVFDMSTNTVKTVIHHSGSSHNGAFVQYTVNGDAWSGQVLADQAGFHGSARAAHEDALGVKDITYGGTTTSVSLFR